MNTVTVQELKVAGKPAVRVRKRRESELKVALERLEGQIRLAREELNHVRSRLDGLLVARDTITGTSVKGTL